MGAFLKVAALAAVICGAAVRPAAWRNSELGPRQARKKGLCGSCGGKGRFGRPVPGRLGFVVCEDCEGSGKHRR